jgi:iron complex outermembrane receptor protein
MKPNAFKLALLFLAAGIHAQSEIEVTADFEQDPLALEPIIVTGDLWESELQSVTASVSVLGDETLDYNGVQHFEDVVNAIPNVTWTGGSSRPRFIQIRGIGENSQFEGETPDSAVRFLIDDLDLTGLGTIGNLFDVKQVEVLRGPQAGAFGVNAAGGVVRIVSNDPTSYWTGQAEQTIGNYDLLETGIALGGPILERDPEQLTFRFSIHNLTQDGFRKNRTLNEDDTNERNEFSSRLKVRWLANEDFQLDASFLYADFDNGYDEFTLNNARTSTFSDEPGRDEQETFGTSLKGTYFGFDKVEVTLITNYIDTDSLYSFDGDWTNAIEAAGLFGSSFLEINRDREVYTGDLRFDSVDDEDALGFIDRWTAGIYYERLEENTLTTGFGDFETDYESNTLSFYGQGTHLFSQQTRLTLGLRVEYFDLETQNADGFRQDVDFDDLLFGGKLTLEHDLSESQLTFASITRGYKAGGANIYPFLEVPPFPEEYETEDLWNYEIGLRSVFLDGRLESRITLFFLDRDNAQLRDSEGEGIGFTYFTTNGEGAQHYGLEAEATFHIDDNWSFTTSLGLLETDRESYQITVFDEDLDPGLDPDDIDDLVQESIGSRDLANAPSYTYSARLNYQPTEGLFVGTEVVGSDNYFESNSHNQKRDAFVVFNGSIGYRWKQQWTLTLWGRNLLGEEYAERVFFFDNGLGEQRYEAPAAPRTFGMTANYRW